VLKTIADPPGCDGAARAAAAAVRAGPRELTDPLVDLDLQLSLNLCYELHFLSFRGVETGWEWDPGLLELRAELERLFMRGLGSAVGKPLEIRPDEVSGRLRGLKPDPGFEELVDHVANDAGLSQTRELVIHRSPVKLRQPDPYGWTMARLRGRPRRTLAKLVQNAVPARALYSKTMRAVGLDDRDGAYLDLLPGSTLAEVNLISFFGLHRRAHGAMLGQIAMQEILYPAEDKACGQALSRLGMNGDAAAYFGEAEHRAESLAPAAVFEMAEGLARIDPKLGPDIILGARAMLAVQKRLVDRMLERWRGSASSLLPERPRADPRTEIPVCLAAPRGIARPPINPRGDRPVTKDHGPSIKDDGLYEKLREEGDSKEKAARIANAKAGGKDVSSEGGKAEGYEDRTVDELRDRAAELNIEGRSGMDKEGRIFTLRNR